MIMCAFTFTFKYSRKQVIDNRPVPISIVSLTHNSCLIYLFTITDCSAKKPRIQRIRKPHMYREDRSKISTKLSQAQSKYKSTSCVLEVKSECGKRSKTAKITEKNLKKACLIRQVRRHEPSTAFLIDLFCRDGIVNGYQDWVLRCRSERPGSATSWGTSSTHRQLGVYLSLCTQPLDDYKIHVVLA
ncbi:hypothetical protein BC629DRAFT_1448888 [Irpex lacteus]|nr:hypothetical protein BC629DRAFT_1448888 [Irpex lacteus]